MHRLITNPNTALWDVCYKSARKWKIESKYGTALILDRGNKAVVNMVDKIDYAKDMWKSFT